MFIPALLGAAGAALGGGAAAAGGAAAGAAGWSLAGTVLSTALGVGGAVMQGMAASDAAKYQAAVARNNAKMAQDMADYEKQKGVNEAYDQDLASRQQRGKIAAGLAASGFDMNEGTPQAIMADSAQLSRLDAMRKAYGGELSGWKYQAQAKNFMDEAALDEMKGKNAVLGSWINAGSSLIGGATSFADKWNNYKYRGAF